MFGDGCSILPCDRLNLMSYSSQITSRTVSKRVVVFLGHAYVHVYVHVNAVVIVGRSASTSTAYGQIVL